MQNDKLEWKNLYVTMRQGRSSLDYFVGTCNEKKNIKDNFDF